MIIGFVLVNSLPIIELLVQVQMTTKSSFGMSMIRKDLSIPMKTIKALLLHSDSTQMVLALPQVVQTSQ